MHAKAGKVFYHGAVACPSKLLWQEHDRGGLVCAVGRALARTHEHGELGPNVVVGGKLHKIDAVVADLIFVVCPVVYTGGARDIEVGTL